jgi:opacity protein-like surface antigen
MKRFVLFLAVALSLTTASAATAQSNFGLKALGGAIGYVSPENLDGVFSIGGFADLGTVAPNIGIEARIDHWGWSETQFGVETNVRDFQVGARGKYYFPTANPKVRPFAGAGLAAHFLSFEVQDNTTVPGYSVSDSQNKLGLDIGGGIATPINPKTDFLAEAWYGIVTDWSQFSLRAGLQYKIGN